MEMKFIIEFSNVPTIFNNNNNKHHVQLLTSILAPYILTYYIFGYLKELIFNYTQNIHKSINNTLYTTWYIDSISMPW